MSPEERQIDVRLDGPEWNLGGVSATELVGQVLARAEAALGPLRPGDLEVWFASDAQIRALNRRYRDLDRPTNVLSFAGPAAGPGAPVSQFGQLALASGVCAREAKAAGICLAAHVRHLILHGLLHLQGYDHETDDEAHVMQGLESTVMIAMGLEDPYGQDGARNHG